MLVEKGAVSFLVSERLAGFENIRHGFLTRRGGVSPAPFDSLNFSARVGDDTSNVEENTARSARACGFPPGSLATIHQVHGRRIAVMDGDLAATDIRDFEGDGIVTSTPGVAVGILTADCLPVLIYDPGRNIVAAVHAGWRGTALGIAASAVRTMTERFGCRPEDIAAATGPAIGPCCYTVGELVRKEFDANHTDATGCFSTAEDGSLRLDLAIANIRQLEAAGVQKGNITSAGHCTSCSTDLFYSHRKESGATGRQLSFIMLER